ncbi:YrzI family small protein [Bacillus sp. FJAT-52991]|uniref:YrzI family small protein n=1 Tax=Bacillus kandeliae TaxID=3129297 RepID=A0ABZ2NBT2_9BACI
MTINLIFVIITIKKREKTVEEYIHEQRVEEIYDEMRNKQQEQMNHLF